MKDLIDQLHAVHRHVGTGEVPAGAARVVTLRRTYPADVEDVWDAVTDPERIARWFLPVTGDLRLGGTYQLEGNAGGEIRACEPPTRLLVTWIFGEEPGPQDASLVEVRLRPADGGTELQIEHAAVVPPEFWDTYGPGAVGVGWDLALLGLGLYLGGGAITDPNAWGESREAREFMTLSSNAWGAATVAGGDHPDAVAVMVANTTQFYAPDPPAGPSAP